MIRLEDIGNERHHIFDIKLTNGQAFDIRSRISTDNNETVRQWDSHEVSHMTAGDRFTLKIVIKPDTDDVSYATISINYKNSCGMATTENFPVTEYSGHYLEDSEYPRYVEKA